MNPPAAIQIDPTRRAQTVEGWGTSLAWWANVIGGWSTPAQNALADLLFSPAVGLGLTIARYNIGGGDAPDHHHMRPGAGVPGYQPSAGVWDWAADANQRAILQAARARGATLCEAFANSPPYWMTRSGCAAGAADGGNNLPDANVDLFAAYLAEVVAHFARAWNVVFRSVEPFNEPSATWWTQGHNQEGCHVSRPQQQAIITRLAAQLAARGVTATTIAVGDENSIDDMVATFDSYDPTILSSVTQINTHSYNGTRRAELAARAAQGGQRLWMSEYGTGGGPHDHQAIAPALALSQQIRQDMSVLQPTAWVYWQAVENEASNNWGLIHAAFAGPGEQYWPTKQYYAMGQYSRFIRPGYTILGAGDTSLLAAYEQASGTLVLVYDNSTARDASIELDLSLFTRVPGSAILYRTSAAENVLQLAPMPLTQTTLTVPSAAQSITTVVMTGAIV